MLKLLKIIIASSIITFAYQGFAADEQSELRVEPYGEQTKDENSTVENLDEDKQTDETNMAIERQIKEKARKRFPQRQSSASGEESRRVLKK